MPKYQVASRRNKYGVAKSYGLFERQRKAYDMMTVDKENQLGPPALDPIYAVDESLLVSIDTISVADSSSVSQDSLNITVITSKPVVLANNDPKYKYRYRIKNPYNHDQEYYNKYYGELFIDKRPPPVKKVDLSSILDTSLEVDSLGQKKKRSFIPKFLSKKRKKKEAESEDELEEETIEENLEEEEGN